VHFNDAIRDRTDESGLMPGAPILTVTAAMLMMAGFALRRTGARYDSSHK